MLVTLLQTTQPSTIQAISENTQVSLWVAVVVGLFVIGVVLKVNAKLNSICTRLTNIEARAKETWTRDHQKVFSLELELRNAKLGLIVPNPYTIAPAPPQEGKQE